MRKAHPKKSELNTTENSSRISFSRSQLIKSLVLNWIVVNFKGCFVDFPLNAAACKPNPLSSLRQRFFFILLRYSRLLPSLKAPKQRISFWWKYVLVIFNYCCLKVKFIIVDRWEKSSLHIWAKSDTFPARENLPLFARIFIGYVCIYHLSFK